MKFAYSSFLLPIAFSALVLAAPAEAKDQQVSLSSCPAPVQAVIQHYSKQGSLEGIGYDEKKKSGGPAVYEAKFALANGKRVEVHIAADGRVVKFEQKGPKN